MKSAAALLVGWSEFDHHRDLPHVKTGVPALERRLRRVLMFDDGHLQTALDPEEPRHVLETIGDLSGADVDVFLVFLSSHGMSGEGGLLLASQKTRDHRDDWNSTPLLSVVKEVSRATAPLKLIIVDSCLSGQVTGFIPAERSKAASGSGTMLLASAGPYETAVAVDGAELSVFMEALLDALDGSADWPREFSVDELAQRVTADIAQVSPTLPTPKWISSNGVGSYPVFTNERFDPDTSPEGPDDVDYDLLARVLVVGENQTSAERTAKAMCALRDRKLAQRVEWRVADTPAAALESSLEYFDIIVVGTETSSWEQEPFLELLRRLNPSASITFLAPVDEAGVNGGGGALSCFRFYSGADAFEFPLDAEYVLINGDHFDYLRNLVQSVVSKRLQLLTKVRGAHAAVLKLVERFERRNRIGQASTQSLGVEMNRCLCELLGDWLRSRGRAQAERLVDGFRLEVVDEGISSCLVFRVDPEGQHFGGTSPGSMLLKVGPRIEIEDEIERYRRYVQVGPEIRHRTDVVATWLGTNVAGALYGGCGISVNSEARLGLRSDIEPEKVVSELLSPSSVPWYKVSGLQPSQLLTYFNQFGFTIDSAKDAVLRQAELASELFGDPSDDDETTLRLVRPKTRWLDSEALTNDYEVVIVHGELHFGNIVVRDNGSFGLVDYRNLGPGPRCIDFATADLNSLLGVSIPDGMSDVEAFRSLVDLLTADLWPERNVAARSEVPDWLAGYAVFNSVLKEALSDFPEFSRVEIDEYLACLFMVALRRSSFVGLASDPEAARRDRLVVLAVLSTIAQLLSFEPTPSG